VSLKLRFIRSTKKYNNNIVWGDEGQQIILKARVILSALRP
jgi:hypothetical protein